MSPTPILARSLADLAFDDAALLDLSLPDSQELVHHPDGYYWLAKGGRLQIGPYASAEQALADLHRTDEDDIEPEETLPEVEQELGLADWVDPDTGELAEGTHTRIEDH